MSSFKKPEEVDMDIARDFFDAHPGFAGTAVPIPPAIRRVANELDGRMSSLNDAVARLRAVGIGTIEVVHKFRYISLRIGGSGRHLEHLFCVIKYQ